MKISRKAKTKLKKLAERYKLKLVLAFGSRVTKKMHLGSDFDIAVLLQKNDLTFKQHSSLSHKLQTIFPSCEIDLVLINHTDPLLLKKILENCQILYGSYKELAKLKLYSFKRYCDYKIFLKKLFIQLD